MPNSFGKLFTITPPGAKATAPAVGVAIDGIRPGCRSRRKKIRRSTEPPPANRRHCHPRTKEDDRGKSCPASSRAAPPGCRSPCSCAAPMPSRGLRRDARKIPPLAYRLHLPGEVWPPRPSRRWPQLGETIGRVAASFAQPKKSCIWPARDRQPGRDPRLRFANPRHRRARQDARRNFHIGRGRGLAGALPARRDRGPK